MDSVGLEDLICSEMRRNRLCGQRSGRGAKADLEHCEKRAKFAVVVGKALIKPGDLHAATGRQSSSRAGRTLQPAEAAPSSRPIESSASFKSRFKQNLSLCG